MSEVRPGDARSTVGLLLGDTLAGSCWRAVEQAEAANVEVRIYVRSLAEALVAVDMTCAMLTSKGLVRRGLSEASVRQQTKALGALAAIELTNGSVVALMREATP